MIFTCSSGVLAFPISIILSRDKKEGFYFVNSLNWIHLKILLNRNRNKRDKRLAQWLGKILREWVTAANEKEIKGENLEKKKTAKKYKISLKKYTTNATLKECNPN